MRHAPLDHPASLWRAVVGCAGCAFSLGPQTASCGAAVASALSAQTGLEIEILNDGTGVDKRKKLTIGIRPYYAQAPASADDSAMDMDIP